MAKRFYAPLMVSGVPNAENNTVDIHVTNDRTTAQTATIEYFITDAQGKVLEQDSFTATMNAGTTGSVRTVDVGQWIKDRSARDVLFWVQLRSDSEPASEDLALFCRPKHLELKQPTITTTVRSTGAGEYDVELTTEFAALYVWLELPDAKFSDNFVHLRPNASKVIHVTAPDITGLKVQSLFDTYS